MIQMHDQKSIAAKVPFDVPKALDLVMARKHELKGVSGYHDEIVSFAYVKGPHVTLDPADVWDVGTLVLGYLQQLGRQIKPSNLDSLSGKPQGNAACPAGDFEHVDHLRIDLGE
jgi:hypothetical protein